MTSAVAFVLVALYAAYGIHPIKGYADHVACETFAKTAPVELVPHIWCIPIDEWADDHSGTIDANEVHR